MGVKQCSTLTGLIKDNTSFDSFTSELKNNKYNGLLDTLKTYLSNIPEAQINKIEKKSDWYEEILTMELNLMYRVYYGEKHVQDFYRRYPLDPGRLQDR